MESQPNSGPSNGSSSSNTTPSTNGNNKRRHRPRNRNKTANANGNSNGQASENSSLTPSPSSTDNPHSPQHPRNRNRPSQRIQRADPSKVVRRPQRKNPKGLTKRSQEIEQLKRGYPSMFPLDPQAGTDDSSEAEKFLTASKYSVSFKPSDPDFPFDINILQFMLYIPQAYPREAPSITVTNSEIPQGFSTNIDLGFRNMAREGLGTRTLLDLVIELDKNLEEYLKQEKRPTIKMVKFKGSSSTSKPATANNSGSSGEEEETPKAVPVLQKPKLVVPPEVQAERSKQIDQMLHRLGTEVVEYVSGDDHETIYNLTLTPQLSPDSKHFESLLPHEFNQTLNVMLQIPRAYYLQPCTIIITNILDDDTNESRFPIATIESNFNKSAKRNTHWTILTHINFLVSRLGKLMRPDYLEYFDHNTTADPKEKGKAAQNGKNIPNGKQSEVNVQKEEKGDASESEVEAEQENLKFTELQEKARRILLALNPLNQNSATQDEDHDDHDASDDSHEQDEHEEDDSEDEVEDLDPDDMPNLEPRGIALHLPELKLSNIGLLECQFLNLVVKCGRCGTQNDFLNITSGPFGRESKPIAEECIKCKNVLAVSFRKNLIHLQGSSPPVAGYLDVSGCTPFDALASTYVATCENCVSTNTDAPFRRVERGKSAAMNCRECHLKMKMELGPEIVFEKVSEDSLALERLKGIRVIKQQSRNDETKQKLGITSGKSLPDDGACTHYRKSRRWYRFSCCGKVFPCDKCHDADSNHSNEYATRIICGKCSREQNITPICVYCRFEFQTKSTGFWEGGKGTRDPTKLNRNDTRKHKKLPGNKGKGKSGTNRKAPASAQA